MQASALPASQQILDGQGSASSENNTCVTTRPWRPKCSRKHVPWSGRPAAVPCCSGAGAAATATRVLVDLAIHPSPRMCAGVRPSPHGPMAGALAQDYFGRAAGFRPGNSHSLLLHLEAGNCKWERGYYYLPAPPRETRSTPDGSQYIRMMPPLRLPPGSLGRRATF